MFDLGIWQCDTYCIGNRAAFFVKLSQWKIGVRLGYCKIAAMLCIEIVICVLPFFDALD